MTYRSFKEAKELHLEIFRKAIQDGMNSEVAKEFNPDKHLKLLKSQNKKDPQTKYSNT